MGEQEHIGSRLMDQQKWYSRKSSSNKHWYHGLKVIAIFAAALIPFIVNFPRWVFIAGILGILIVIVEGLQGLFQFHDNWTLYRSTSEALKREYNLWVAKAGVYRLPKNPDALLAERVELIISKEHNKWISIQDNDEKEKPQNEK